MTNTFSIASILSKALKPLKMVKNRLYLLFFSFIISGAAPEELQRRGTLLRLYRPHGAALQQS